MAPPFTNLSPGYQELLSSLNGSFVNPLTLTMSALVPGATYQFEWWVDQSELNSPLDPRPIVTATAGNAITLAANTSPSTDGGLGQFALGIFTGDASGHQTITFDTSITGPGLLIPVDLNGFQLREIPEPSALALLVVSVVGLLFCGRKKSVQ
jgi:hypothetical protein